MEKIEIDLCPFCKTELAAGATVCARCGARKGRRGDSYSGGTALFRLGFWMCGPGAVLFVAWVLIPVLIWTIMTGHQRWHEVIGGVGSNITDAWPLVKSVPDLLAAVVLGSVTYFSYYVYKPVNKVWKMLFGSISDEVWYR